MDLLYIIKLHKHTHSSTDSVCSEPFIEEGGIKI